MAMGIPTDQVDAAGATLVQAAEVAKGLGVPRHEISTAAAHNFALVGRGRRPKGALRPEHEREAARLLR